MTTQFKDRYQEWNEKVQPSGELLGRLLSEIPEEPQGWQTAQPHRWRWGRGIAVAAALLLAVNISLPVLAGAVGR